MRLYKTNDTWGDAIFLSQGYYLNNLGRSLLDEATYQISKAYMGVVIFDPRAII